MTDLQRQQHRDLYQQLRLALVMPGESIGGITKPYAAVNRDDWTWDMAIAAPPTPRIAYLQRRYPLAGLLRVGMRG